MEHRLITIALAVGALATSEDEFTRDLAKNACFALHDFAEFDYPAVPDEGEDWYTEDELEDGPEDK